MKRNKTGNIPRYTQRNKQEHDSDGCWRRTKPDTQKDKSFVHVKTLLLNEKDQSLISWLDE